MENTVAFLARFPMPAVVLSALLAVGHLVLRISDDLRPPLFLQPASTIIRPQQVVTAGLFEDSAPNLLVVVLALLYSATLSADSMMRLLSFAYLSPPGHVN